MRDNPAGDRPGLHAVLIVRFKFEVVVGEVHVFRFKRRLGEHFDNLGIVLLDMGVEHVNRLAQQGHLVAGVLLQRDV